MGEENAQAGESSRSVDLLEDSIRLGRQENAIFMNRVRVVLAVTFAIVYTIGILRVENTSLGWTIPHMLVWVGASVLLWLLGKRLKPLLNLSRLEEKRQWD